ncbi:MAG: DUF169 domain-containing protein [Nitrososphaerota archaeon]
MSFNPEDSKHLPMFKHSVPSSYAFWTLAHHDTFTTRREHHINCSIGSVTHGFRKGTELDIGCGCDDVDLLVGSGWISVEDVKNMPSIKHERKTVTYGPMRTIPFEPDIAVLFCSAEQAMVISSCVPTKLVGRPACSGIPVSIDSDTVVISFGCTQSRLRAGYSPDELVVFIPKNRLPELVEKLRKMVKAEERIVAALSHD